MSVNIERLPAFEAIVSNWIYLVGVCIEVFGVFIIVAGIVWSTNLYVRRRQEEWHYDQYKIRIGRSLLGLEVPVAANVVKTIAIELTFTSLGQLAGLVPVRTFLSWTPVREIEGRWPWSRELADARRARRGGCGIMNQQFGVLACSAPLRMERPDKACSLREKS